MTVTIETGIPVPASRKTEKWPFADMSVGDSFFTTKLIAKNAAMNYQRRHGVKFSSRREADGIRIWRVA